jgi:hypothetical protein
MVTDDLELEERVVDIIGLYLHPLQHAAVFSVDERTTIQVPDQSGSVLPESWLHGTLALSAAFDMGVREAPDTAASRHTSAEFNAYLTDIVASQPRGKEIHVVADNVSAHKTVRVNELLRPHRTVGRTRSFAASQSRPIPSSTGFSWRWRASKSLSLSVSVRRNRRGLPPLKEAHSLQ